MAKLNLYPNKKLFAEMQGGKHLKNRHEEVLASRDHVNNHEKLMFGNQAALLPDDAWREVDETTVRIMRGDEGQEYMADLMTVARAVDIGKTAHVYRTSSDINSRVNVTMGGQSPTLMDQVDYDYRGHPVPVFDTGYGLNWREWRGMQSEGFDGIADDQEAAVAAVEQAYALYVLDGDTSINVGGYQGYGIKNHPQTNVMDLDASGFNIDLAADATTSDNIETFFTRDVQKVLHDNFVKRPVNVYASKAIERRWSRSYSGSSGFKGGSLHDFIMSLGFVNDIKYTYELVDNQFMAFPIDPQAIRPLIGMATSTIAIPRVMATDDYNFKVMKAGGLEIKADSAGSCAVIYGAEIA